MFKKKNINKIKKDVFYFVLLVLCSTSTFAQEDPSGWDPTSARYYNPEGAPSDDDPVGLPIDDHIWVLLMLALSLGVYKVKLEEK